MLNLAIVVSNAKQASSCNDAICSSLAGVPAFKDEDCTILVPDPEELENGMYVQYISIGTFEQNPDVTWMVVGPGGLMTPAQIKELKIPTIVEEVFTEESRQVD